VGSSAVQKLRRALSPPSKFWAYDDTASREVLVIKQRILITPKRPRASRDDQTNASPPESMYLIASPKHKLRELSR
jgi:hypothetical protein